MARTRTAGIRIDSDGRRIIDKEHRGVGIYLRLGPISQEDAEQQLANEVARIDAELRYNTNHRHRFVDCAERYLAESKHRRSVDVAAWHIRLLTPYIGMLEIHRIHDATLKLFCPRSSCVRRQAVHRQPQPRGRTYDLASCGAMLSRWRRSSLARRRAPSHHETT